MGRRSKEAPTSLPGNLRPLAPEPPQLPHNSMERPGFIRILPRTGAAPNAYQKKCETCSTVHDGTFGAGRFCSSRCARTVGGLAHRKKRQMERTLLGSHSQSHGSSSTDSSVIKSDTSSKGKSSSSDDGRGIVPMDTTTAQAPLRGAVAKGGSFTPTPQRPASHSRVMAISALLNPSC